MLATLARLLRIASAVICLIVIASFAIFAVGQTNTASNRQQEVLASPTNSVAASQAASKPVHEDTLHRYIDEASNTITSPFSSITAGYSSEWATRGLDVLLVLIVYGLGLGFLARMIAVRL